MNIADSYDVIVCGGGTAGCVVAGRLADDPGLRVLLIEAGGEDRATAVSDPRLWMSNIGSERDWGFRAAPSASLNGRAPPLPMGKVLGGGSSINGLIWARGHKADFDHWADEVGDPAWSYDAVVELYKTIEDWDGPPNEKLRGTGGPVYVTLPQDPVPVAHALVAASASAGIPAVADLNAETMEGPGGAGIANITVKNGDQRISMASAFIRPKRGQPNLTVLLDATVMRLTLRGTRVTGVELIWRGAVHTILAAKEVVLSSGAINTPKILMLSGIGDAAELARHGIPVVQHLPGVGRNFQDHILVAGCVFEYRTPEPPRNNSAEFTFFWRSDALLAAPDLQPVLEERAFGSEITAQRHALPADPALCWTLAPGLISPKSRGHLALTGSRPQDPIIIHANFLSAAADVKALVRATELCREIGHAAQLREFVRREIMPGPIAGDTLVAFLRDAAGTYFHQTGTAKMGRDENSVVDGRLKVYGIEALRIADGSVMPTITRGNTMAPCALIGARAAQLIRSSHAPCRFLNPKEPLHESPLFHGGDDRGEMDYRAGRQTPVSFLTGAQV
jgi:choline dehydrogenase